MLTIKSDDVIGRAKAYEAIIKGDEIQKPQIPASFAVLVRELQGLGLNVEVIETEERMKELKAKRMLVKTQVTTSDDQAEIKEKVGKVKKIKKEIKEKQTVGRESL